MFERKRKRVPGLNTTATADISFMLLIFFLVASAMDTDKGLPRQLPPPQDNKVEQDLHVKQRNIMEIRIDGHDQLTIDRQPATPEELTSRIADFVANTQNVADMPEKSRREVHLLGLVEVSDRHILSVQVDRNTSYDAYFQMQNAIVAAYARLRNELAVKRFRRSYTSCRAEEREAINMVYPQRISEDTPTEEEGGEP